MKTNKTSLQKLSSPTSKKKVVAESLKSQWLVTYLVSFLMDP
jgi:hypothetical protein